METETKIIVTACAYCKQIRNHESVWIELTDAAKLVATYTFGEFGLSHTYCPSCTEENLPAMMHLVEKERNRENSGYYSRSLCEDQKRILKLLTAMAFLEMPD